MPYIYDLNQVGVIVFGENEYREELIRKAKEHGYVVVDYGEHARLYYPILKDGICQIPNPNAII